MTKEEAINRLKQGAPFSELVDEEWEEALDIALSVLSSDGEYIKKKEALKAFEKSLLGKYILWDTQDKIKKDMQERISQLPTYSFPDSAENKGDLISRGEVESVLHNNLHALISTDQLYQLYKDIDHLPNYSIPNSAEDNTMEWLENEDGSYECSKCHITRSGLISGDFNFCPNCGRKAVQR